MSSRIPNPYQAPSVPLDHPSEPRPPRRIEIRLIPAVACAWIGGLILLATIAEIVALAWLLHKQGWPVAARPRSLEELSPTPANFALRFALLIVGWGWITASREWTRGHWWRASLTTIGLSLILGGLPILAALLR